MPVSCASLLRLRGDPDVIRGNNPKEHGVKKGLAEPYADITLILTLSVDMAAH